MVVGARETNSSNKELRAFAARYFDGTDPIPQLAVAVLRSLINYVSNEALYMGQLSPDTGIVVINKENLRAVLDKRPLIITTADEAALESVAVEDSWPYFSMRHCWPVVRLIRNIVLLPKNPGADIAREMKLKLVPPTGT